MSDSLVMTRFRSLLFTVCVSLGASADVAAQELKPRPGWSCPNRQSFDDCTHSCKYIELVNGAPDVQRELDCGTEIAAHSPKMQKINSMLDSAYNSCSRINDVIQKISPCNFFAARVMADVYGVKDLQTPAGYMVASQINGFLKDSPAWERVDAAYAHMYANQGHPVLASTPGHVAVVVPGVGSYSYGWKEYTPIVAALFQENVTSAVKCMPCFSNYAFGAKPAYFYRKP